MQLCAANTEAGSTGEHPLSRSLIVEVADAAKRIRVHLSQIHSEAFQDHHPVRHQTLAAGPVHRRPGSVEDSDLEAPEARRDGGGQPRRAPSRDHDVSPHISPGFVARAARCVG